MVPLGYYDSHHSHREPIVADTPEPAPPQICRRRLPFVFSVVVAFFSLSVLTAWAATDASFRIATWKARVALHLEPVRSANPEMAEALGIMDAIRDIHCDALGKRAIVFYVVFTIGCATTAVCCYLAARRLTTRGIICCLALLACWGSLYGTLDTIQDWRAHRQVAYLLPRVEQAASALHEQWPTEPGEIPPGIKFYVNPDKYPDVLTIRGPRPSYPFHEDLGFMITRGQDGIIRFDLAAAYDSTIEFHPKGTQPAKYFSGFGHPSPPVASVIHLKGNWFLVRYGGT
jgi:hypothetical protein